MSKDRIICPTNPGFWCHGADCQMQRVAMCVGPNSHQQRTDALNGVVPQTRIQDTPTVIHNWVTNQTQDNSLL